MRLLVDLTITCLLLGCGTTNVKTGDQIPADVRTEISEIDQVVISSMHHGDLSILGPYMSEMLREAAGEGINRYLNDAQRVVVDTNYSLLHEFFVTYASTELPNTLQSGGVTDEDFIFEFKTINKDAYISLILIEGENDQHLITNIYGDYGGEWKLNTTQFRPYSIGGMTAPQYFNKAETQHEAGQLALAKISMQLAQLCIKPCGYWTYRSEENIREFGLTVTQDFESNYSFPISIGDAEVFQISPQLDKDGVVPIIRFVTSHNLTDTLSLAAQRDVLVPKMDSLFPGIDEYPLFYLSAYNVMPDGQTNPEHVELVSK